MIMMRKRTEKELLPRTAVDELLVRDTEDLHNAGKLLLFILAREYGEPSV